MFLRRGFPLGLGLLLVALTAGAQTPPHLWSHSFGNSQQEHGESLAVDPADNVIVAGFFQGTVDFGGGPLKSTAQDIILVKFGPAGNFLWSRQFPASSEPVVTVDDAGCILLTGGFTGTVDFGGGPLTSAGGQDIFLAKFDPDGNHLWSQNFGDADYQFARGIAVDGAGNLVLTGYFSGNLDFGGGNLVSAGGWDVFLAKLAGPDGSHLWSHSFGDPDPQYGKSLACDGAGDVVLAGNFQDSLDLGGGVLTSAGGWDIFLAKFTGSDGGHLWSRSFGDADNQHVRSLGCDCGGSVVLGGYFAGSVDFGGGALPSAGSNDIFLVKFDPAGNHRWSHRFGDAWDQRCEDIVVTDGGCLVATGHVSGTVDFGGGPLISAGYYDAFLAEFSPAGGHLWSDRFGDAWFQFGEGVVLDRHAGLVATGYFEGSVDFGGGLLVSAGFDDIWLAKFGPAVTAAPHLPDPGRLLVRAYPNPFNPLTTITYSLPVAGPASLQVYDLQGRLVRTLVAGWLPAGECRVSWDGRDQQGAAVAAGTYTLRLESGPQAQVTKVLLLK